MGAQRFFHLGPAGKPEALPDLAAALAARERPGYVWFDCLDPTREQLTLLAGPLGLHPLAVEDCLDEDQVPKLEAFPGHAFILFNAYHRLPDGLALEEVDLFLGDRFLVSVHGRGVPPEASAFDAALRGGGEALGRGPDQLLHALLDHVVDRKLGVLEGLQDELEAAEEGLFEGLAEFNPRDLLHIRRALLVLRKSLFHEREILIKICRRDLPHVSERAIFQFRDVYDHLTKFFELVEITREMVSHLMELHLSMVNNQMARVSNRTNRAVRRLTLITTIFMPLTLLAGIGGMSEWSMMTGAQNWRWSYPLFLAGMVVLGALSYLLLGRLDARTARGAGPRDVEEDPPAPRGGG